MGGLHGSGTVWSVTRLPNYHIIIDWEPENPSLFGVIVNGRLTCNGHMVWRRLREVMAEFITGIDGMISFAEGRGFNVTSSSPLGSVRRQTPSG